MCERVKREMMVNMNIACRQWGRGFLTRVGES